MLIFKRILNFKEEAVQASEQRQTIRYAVGPTFPFKTVLTLQAHDSDGHLVATDTTGRDWAGRLVNLSSTGASIQIHHAAAGARGEACYLRFSLDSYHLQLAGTIAHFRVYRDYALCGLQFAFPDFPTQKAYLQLLEPVAIGASLTPVDPKKIKQTTPDLHMEQFTGDSSALLTIWRSGAGGPLHSFDFRMNNYGVRWGTGMTELDTYGLTDPAGKKSPVPLRLTEAQQEEVRWLFCLAVPNLAKAVPMDVRKFLGQLVAA